MAEYEKRLDEYAKKCASEDTPEEIDTFNKEEK